MNDDEIEPDEEFYVQLQDPVTSKNLIGRDTRTKVIILDDDGPKALTTSFAFARTEYNVAEDCGTAKVKIYNTKG